MVSYGLLFCDDVNFRLLSFTLDPHLVCLDSAVIELAMKIAAMIVDLTLRRNVRILNKVNFNDVYR